MIGDLFTREGELENGEEWLNSSKTITEEFFSKNPRAMSWTLGNLALLYCKARKYKMSKEKNLETLQLRKDLDDPILLAQNYYDLAYLSYKCKSLEEAEDYVHQGMREASKFSKRCHLMGRLKCILGKIFFKLDKIETAKKCFLEGIKILEESLPKGNSLVRKNKNTYQKLFPCDSK